MSQSTLLNDEPGGSPRQTRWYGWSVAVLRTTKGWLQALDQILRGETTRPSVLREQSLRIPVAGLSLLILGLALFYGFCMGTYPGLRVDDPSGLRWLACTVKIPALFFLTLFVTFPSLYVVNALVGSRLYLPSVMQLLVAALAVNLAVLASVGPIVAFFSFSTTNWPFMILLNVLVFAISGLLGMKFLLQTLHRMSTLPSAVPPKPDEAIIVEPEDGPCALDPLEGHVLGRHVKTVFCCWTVIFSVVGAQMAWVLRPYFGSPHEAFVWFGPRTSNFFEGVWGALRQLLFQS